MGALLVLSDAKIDDKVPTIRVHTCCGERSLNNKRVENETCDGCDINGGKHIFLRKDDFFLRFCCEKKTVEGLFIFLLVSEEGTKKYL